LADPFLSSKVESHLFKCRQQCVITPVVEAYCITQGYSIILEMLLDLYLDVCNSAPLEIAAVFYYSPFSLIHYCNTVPVKHACINSVKE
jgi:hypothetical protein